MKILKIECLDVKGAQEIAKAINDCATYVKASWCKNIVTLVEEEIY